MLCSFCEKRPVRAKGLCAACYTRQQRHGVLTYRRKGVFTYCSVEDCGEIAHAQKLCFKHYQRHRKHGHTKETRPANWGVINAHPLIEQWNYLHRKRGAELCAPEWLRDFDRFVSDVGEKPGEGYRLRPRDKTQLIGPNNFVWEPPVTDRAEGETRQEYYRRKERERRSENPEYFRNLDLRKKYGGLTLAGVAAMSERQEHRCAICGGEENTVINGQKISLAVDHDHTTGIVRGLLCVRCNRGLGLFRDDPVLLTAAMAYLANPPGPVLPLVAVKRRSRTK